MSTTTDPTTAPTRHADTNALPAFTTMVDLASERMGGCAVATNDDFFASMHNLVLATEPVFIEGKYTDRGKWMDGWESRRRRTPGHDWAILELGVPGVLHGFDVDTAHFVGNFPEHCSIDGTYAPGGDASQLVGDAVEWFELVPQSPLRGGSHNHYEVAADAARTVTHVRLNIYPDGGVARLRAYGEVRVDWASLQTTGKPIDLAAAVNGGTALSCNDEFFCNKGNLVLPGDAAHMGDGWETRRRRTPGNDWIVVSLGHAGTIDEAIVDTMHYKGNFPESCSLEGIMHDGDRNALDCAAEAGWRELLPRTPLHADTLHRFTDELRDRGPFTHVRLSIYPDGGVARLRLFGTPTGTDA